MKKFSWLMSLLVVAALSLVGCEENKQPSSPETKLTFELFINDTDKQAATYVVVPSDATADYVAIVRESIGLSEYETDEQLVAALKSEVNLADYTTKGDSNKTVTDLKINTAYTLLVFGVDVANDYALTTEISRSKFRTDAVMSIDCTFVVETTITNTTASFIVEPSNRDTGWSFIVMEQMEYLQLTDAFGEYKLTDADVIRDEVTAQINEFVNNGGSIEDAIAEYVKVSNQKLKVENLAPTTEYVFLAAAVEVVSNEIYVISDVHVGRFTSGETAMDAADFTLTATNVTAYSFVLNVETTNEDVYYYPTIAFPASYDEAAQIAEINSLFKQQYELWLIKYKDNPSVVTNELVLEESLYFSKGNKSFSVKNIPPQTDVMGAIFTMRPSSGKVAKVYTFENLATTAAINNISPSIKVVGIYSGDEENGEIFGDAYKTAGRAIIVAESSNFDNAAKVYAVLGERDRTDTMTEAFSDANILWYYDDWVDVALSEPYSFHTANWDAKAFLFVYATDENGIEGNVGRTELFPSSTDACDPISELKEYYDKVDAVTSAVPASLVINE